MTPLPKFSLAAIGLIAALSSPVATAQSEPLNTNLCQQHGLIQTLDDRTVLYTLDYFGTSIGIEIFDAGTADAQAALCHSLQLIKRYHQLASDYSTYTGVTNIKSLNLAPTQTHHVEPELFELIEMGIQWHEISKGYFNIAIGPVVQLWRQQRFTCEQQDGVHCAIPSQQALEEAATHTKISNITLDKTNHSVTMADGMSLDMGGIAKGWMVEKVLNYLKHQGVRSVVINAGGNIRHFGQHPQERAFVTAIENPVCRKHQFQLPGCDQLPIRYSEVIKGEDITVVTSGNYLKYYQVGDREYHHIIDPTTLYPKQGGVATSVVLSSNHVFADVLSTTLFLMPTKQAQALAESLPYLEAMWTLDESGNRLYSSGFSRYTQQ
ncbi:FAD:protein FMN transferase [Ferrimonas aestuarii]|uniref:FAD:protein FMN transferase n=1 Tax=Ferrimonas aestuarii TaxID=2569539 RepID=A0A4U1BK25_9GAMM|nr:FAD:protein FMN transferase [Ferrimonas aestuarii]TKB51960.1 FAD:protein FMN transferase [Ferrimonas aestuarii]